MGVWADAILGAAGTISVRQSEGSKNCVFSCRFEEKESIREALSAFDKQLLCKMASQDEEKINIKAALSMLSCPFTWDLLDAYLQYKSSKPAGTLLDDYEDECDEVFQLSQLINLLFMCYINVMSNESDVAETKLRESETLLKEIQEKTKTYEGIRAIEHIFYATKCYFLYDMDDTCEIEIILKDIVNTAEFSEEEWATVYGCQSILWSLCHDFGVENAVTTALKAVTKHQDNALWHFVLAKNLRRKRRITDFHSNPTPDEELHFELAYAMSKNPLFGIYYAQMIREHSYGQRDRRKWKEIQDEKEQKLLKIYKEILDLHPKYHKIYLKLALGFLRIKNSNELSSAKYCLDEAQKLIPDNSTYLHYMAIFYKQCGNYKQAVEYFEKAIAQNNFAAEMEYVTYGFQIGKINPTEQLLKMLEKYKTAVKERQQTMLLAVATCYYDLHKDLKNAAQYYLKAIQIDPASKLLKSFYRFLDFDTRHEENIYGFLGKRFLLEAQKAKKRDPSLDKLCSEISQYCHTYAMDNISRSFSHIRTS